MKRIIPIIIAIVSIIFFIIAFVLLVKDKEDTVKKYQEKIDSLNEKIEQVNKDRKDEQEKNETVLKACDETLSHIKSTYIGRNLNGDELDEMSNKYVTENLFHRISPYLVYMNSNGTVVKNPQQAKIYFYSATDYAIGIFYKKGVTYSDLELLYTNDEVAITKLVQKSSTDEVAFYPVFVKDGNSWKLNAY